LGCRGICRRSSTPPRRSWRADGKAMPVPWTGGLWWICRSRRRWAAGGPAPTPEQLFAVGYAACFQSALFAVANGQKVDASESQIHLPGRVRPDRARRLRADRRAGPARAVPDKGAGHGSDGPRA
jgi:hypothetical protein